MRVHGLAWVGTRTDRAPQMAAFVRDVLGLAPALEQDDFWVLKMPDGAKVEVFGPDSHHNRHFSSAPVAGFLVDDVFAATEELRAAGAEVVQEPVLDPYGNAWVHFRAPDGNLYELTQDPGVLRQGRGSM